MIDMILNINWNGLIFDIQLDKERLIQLFN